MIQTTIAIIACSVYFPNVCDAPLVNISGTVGVKMTEEDGLKTKLWQGLKTLICGMLEKHGKEEE
jgi:hypothetical protein